MENREMLTISKDTARRFLLMKQGLFGAYVFAGKQGAYDYIRQSGCIQYDPVDAYGKNAELSLQSRVKGFKKRDLHNLLYRDRKLFDYPDKEISIIPMEDWPYFERYRAICRENGKKFEGLAEYEQQALDYIRRKGAVSSSSIQLEGEVYWYSSIHWSGDWNGGKTKAARSVLEQLYTTGDLIIHHKDGSRKYYDLAERYVPDEYLHAEDPLKDDYEHFKWRIKRRIGAVGLLWNRNSTAFLGIRGLNNEIRNRIFAELLETGEIK
ncbi:MAG: winged helix DNA-binding domain-containing protein, partial [Erysipelotrichaceae bacterium]|nr:winged helix DNA-binding domain-containing protein [Erysipelotrichaceae bacterium]